MGICNESCSSCPPAGRLGWQKTTLYITHMLLNHFLKISVMLIGTIDFYHLIPLSLTLTLPGGHKVSAKQNLLASYSRTVLI